MGTEYVLAKSPSEATLSISEMSNRLSLEFLDSGDGFLSIICEPDEPEKLLKIAEEIIKVVSYWVEDPEKILKRYNVEY